ncbi:hypothetical protein OBBRIDRAFT_891674 [Obba rivulosa]|uniref:Uncharacterized protein n=1 Tax=Obba rivulosa TaxID=1052685 RepID=A0A8E2DJC4_9APHY|nr:hypothetical protein OBBRIDRAFT_891674 [Obba rivulosa]
MTCSTALSNWETVPDLHSDEQHHQWDSMVLNLVKHLTPQVVRDPLRSLELLWCILEQPLGHYDSAKTTPTHICKICFESEEFREGLVQALQRKDFRVIRLLKLFRREDELLDVHKGTYLPQTDTYRTELPIDHESTDIIRSWMNPFHGVSHLTLWEHMQRYSKPGRHLRVYPVIGPANIGKSRLVDQYSSEHFVIPLNLSKTPDSYPPPDTQVKQWIDEKTSQLTIVGKAETLGREYDWIRINIFFRTFLIVLFRTAKDVVKQGIRGAIEREVMLDATEKATVLSNFPTTTAAQFRIYMTVGQRVGKPGILRAKFYERVMETTDMMHCHPGVLSDSINKRGQSTYHPDDFSKYEKPTCDSAQDLLAIVDDGPSVAGGLGEDTRNIVVAIDGAEDLQRLRYASNGTPWCQMFAFIRAFRAVDSMPVNCLLISRTWSMFGPPEVDTGPSERFYFGYLKIAPFCSLGFDELIGTDKFVGNGSWTLEKVTNQDYWVRLGRPSWGIQYGSITDSARAGLIAHTVQKLLAGSRMYQYAMVSLADEERFAILSPRLALQFKPMPRELLIDPGDFELVQVERHLRAVLDIDPMSYIRTTITVSPSEPTVVEAASWLMRQEGFQTCVALRSVLKGYHCVSPGHRGEIVVASLILDTLDNCSFDQSGNRTRFILPVQEFIEALLPQDTFEQLVHSRPSRANDVVAGDFAQTFKNAKMYVTHFIKALDLRVLRRDILVRYIVRGAGIICSNKNGGVDIVLPFLYNDSRLMATNVSAVLIRITDIVPHDEASHLALFNDMDPITLCMFPENEAFPVIRILVNPSAGDGLRDPSAPDDKSHYSQVIAPYSRRENKSSERRMDGPGSQYTAFDVWCRGLSSSTFRSIKPEHDEVYADLLKLSRTDWWPKSLREDEDYELVADMIPRSSMSMWPGATAMDESWSSFVETGA